MMILLHEINFRQRYIFIFKDLSILKQFYNTITVYNNCYIHNSFTIETNGTVGVM